MAPLGVIMNMTSFQYIHNRLEVLNQTQVSNTGSIGPILMCVNT